MKKIVGGGVCAALYKAAGSVDLLEDVLDAGKGEGL